MNNSEKVERNGIFGECLRSSRQADRVYADVRTCIRHRIPVERHRINMTMVEISLWTNYANIKFWLALTLSILRLEKIYENCLKKNTLSEVVEKIKKNSANRKSSKFDIFQNTCIFKLLFVPWKLYKLKVMQLKYLLLPLTLTHCIE